MRLQRLFKKEEISWAALVLEVFSVTLSVLVALAIGDWHEERQQQKNVEQTLRGIAAECESNRRTLEDRLSYYLSIQKGIQRRLQEGPKASPLPEWDGLKPIVLSE